MKHVFILNPNAGNGVGAKGIAEELKKYDGLYDYEVYVTRGPMDATEYIRRRCTEDSVTPMRFYACGGDGTLNEVASGIAGFENASMSCYACGSGNDFAKCVGGVEYYRNLADLFEAEEKPVDLLKVNDRYCINIFSFGFDTSVVKVMHQIKHKKIIGGRNAYYSGIIKCFLSPLSTRCRVRVDGEQIGGDELLLCTVANGTFVGGAFNSSPRSRNDDGLIDVCSVKVINRLRFLSVINVYKAGKHLDDPKLQDILYYRQGRVVEVEAQEGFAASLDGEIMDGTYFKIEVLPHHIKFAVPKKLAQTLEPAPAMK